MFMEKNVQAIGVLAAVKYLMDSQEFFLEPYLNGRECGFSIRVNSKAGPDTQIVFSEARGSDKIVVYVGKSTDFSMQGNVPSEKIYNEYAYYFEELELVQAARFIVSKVEETCRGEKIK